MRGDSLTDRDQLYLVAPFYAMIYLEHPTIWTYLFALFVWPVTAFAALMFPIIRCFWLEVSALYLCDGPVKDSAHLIIHLIHDLVSFPAHYYFEPALRRLHDLIYEDTKKLQTPPPVLSDHSFGSSARTPPTPSHARSPIPSDIARYKSPTTTALAIIPTPTQEPIEPEVVEYDEPTCASTNPLSLVNEDIGELQDDIASISSYDMDMPGMPGTFPPSPILSDSSSWYEDFDTHPDVDSPQESTEHEVPSLPAIPSVLRQHKTSAQDDTASRSSYDLDMPGLPGSFPLSPIVSDSSSWYKDFTPQPEVHLQSEVLNPEVPPSPVPRPILCEHKNPPQGDTASIDTDVTRYPASIPSPRDLPASKPKSHKSKPRRSSPRDRHGDKHRDKSTSLVRSLLDAKPKIEYTLTRAQFKEIREEYQMAQDLQQWIRAYGDSEDSMAQFEVYLAQIAAEKEFEAEFENFCSSPSRPYSVHYYRHEKRRQALLTQLALLPFAYVPLAAPASIPSITKKSKFRRALRRFSITSLKVKLSIGKKNKASSLI